MISTAHSPRLAARFGQNTFVIRSETPLAEDQMRRAAPSIFAEGKHGSRSERYTYIPTIDVLRGLRHEGFEPFMVAQSKSRIEGKTEFTKHMSRMRHAGAYFSASWTAFQVDGGRDFNVVVDGVSV